MTPLVSGPVVHVIAPSEVGGAESVIVALASAAKSALQVVALNQTAELEAPPHAFVQQLLGRGVAVTEVRCGRRRYLAEVRALERMLRDQRAALVHTHGYHGSWVGYAASRRVGVPVVATVHGYIGRDLKERLFNAMDRWLLRRFDAVIAVSEDLRCHLVRSGIRPERVHMIQNGLPPSGGSQSRAEARRMLGLPPDGLVIGWVGRLSAEKGPDLFLRSVAGSGIKTQAAVLGDGPELPRLKDLARHIGLREDDGVRFLGHVPDAAAHLPAFDVLALTSRVEGTPMVILEAVAAGVPIVAFRVGGVPAVLAEDAAWLVPPGDVEALRSSLRAALSSPAESRRRAQTAQARLAPGFQTERWVERVWNVYEAAVRRR